MTSEEAAILGRIATTADGGCSYCAADMRDELAEAFPEHAAIFAKAYVEYFGEAARE